MSVRWKTKNWNWGIYTSLRHWYYSSLWIKKARAKDKTYIWVSVWWSLKTKAEKSTRLTYTGLLGELEHLKIETRWVCVFEVITPSTFKLIRKASSLTRVLPTFAFGVTENVIRRKWNSPQFCCASWTPETAKNLSVSPWACKNNSLLNSLCNLPDVQSTIEMTERSKSAGSGVVPIRRARVRTSFSIKSRGQWFFLPISCM
jgi:hypothetical protein